MVVVRRRQPPPVPLPPPPYAGPQGAEGGREEGRDTEDRIVDRGREREKVEKRERRKKEKRVCLWGCTT